METKKTTEDVREKKVTIAALLNEGGVSVSSSEDAEGLTSRGYGKVTENILLLSYCESLYLLSKGIMQLVDEGKKKISFQALLSKYTSLKEDAWFQYLIYRDLRSRGYVVREGFGLGIDFRVYERGEYGSGVAEYLIFGIQEGNPIQVKDLIKTLRYVRNLKKNLILSVLNRRGEVVYYSISEKLF